MLTVLMGKWAIFDGCTAPMRSEAWRLKEGPESLEWASSIDRENPFFPRREIVSSHSSSVNNDGSFSLHPVRQRYARMEDNDVEVAAKRFNRAKHYRYENLESGLEQQNLDR